MRQFARLRHAITAESINRRVSIWYVLTISLRLHVNDKLQRSGDVLLTEVKIPDQPHFSFPECYVSLTSFSEDR